MKIEQYISTVTARMDGALRARVHEELSEHWHDVQSAGSNTDPSHIFGEAELLGKQLTLAMQPSSRTIDTLLALLVACGAFFHTAIMQETLINTINPSLHFSTLWQAAITLVAGGASVILSYAIFALLLGMFVHRLKITAPNTSFAWWAVFLSCTTGAMTSIFLSLFGKTGLHFSSLAPAYLWSVVVTFFLLVLFTVLSYSWAQWFGNLPQRTVDQATAKFCMIAPWIVFLSSCWMIFALSPSGNRLLHESLLTVLSPLFAYTSFLAFPLLFTQMIAAMIQSAGHFSTLVVVNVWIVCALFLPLLFTIIALWYRPRSSALRILFGFLAPLFVITPFFPRLSIDATWNTPVHWSSHAHERQVSGMLYPWSRSSLLVIWGDGLLPYAVYKGDGDVRIFADSTVFFVARGEDIVSLRQESVMPVTSSLSSGIVEQDFSCSRTPVRDAGNWIFPCGTLSYQGKPLADLEDLTLREAIVVPGSNRAVVHVSRGMGSELVTIVELP